MKLRLSEECGIYTKFYVLHFFVWADLWPYCNAYVRPVTRAKTGGKDEKILLKYGRYLAKDSCQNGELKKQLSCFIRIFHNQVQFVDGYGTYVYLKQCSFRDREVSVFYLHRFRSRYIYLHSVKQI